MQRRETSLPGVCELHPKVFRDARGSFVETYHRKKYAELGIADAFVQDNHSSSVRGTLRGLHYQLHHPQAKLCRVVEGEALDVVVDMRQGSPHFGKWAAVLLTAKDENQIYVPVGFAHGYLALTDRVQFLYKCSDYYEPADERGVLWDDPVLKISWGVTTPPPFGERREFSYLSGDSKRISATIYCKMKFKILLIGKNGQVGAELAKLLPRLGEVTALDRHQLDLLKPDQIRHAISDTQPQLIVNAAAYTSVDQAERDEEEARIINADAPALMAEEAKKIGAALVHYSTDYVFDGSKNDPYKENDPTNPINVYGQTKLAGERAIRTTGLPHVIFRTSWVFGTRGRNFLLTILRRATEREELRIVRDQIGAPTWSREIAKGTLDVLVQLLKPERERFSRFSGIYHMTAAGQTSWAEFAKAILEEASGMPRHVDWFAAATGGNPLVARCITPITTAEYPTLARRPAYSVLSNLCLKQTFGLELQDWRTQLRLAFAEGPS